MVAASALPVRVTQTAVLFPGYGLECLTVRAGEDDGSLCGEGKTSPLPQNALSCHARAIFLAQRQTLVAFTTPTG